MNLILDFVPNHVAPDHPWVKEHPEFFIQGTVEDARNNPASYVTVNERSSPADAIRFSQLGLTSCS